MDLSAFTIGSETLERIEPEPIVEPEHILQTKHRIVREAFELYLTHFGFAPIADLKVAIAPGRVNLIGEHIDYCDGFVLPMAIPLYTVIIGREKREPSRDSTFYSSHFKESVTVRAPFSESHEEYPQWSNYIRGVMALTDFLVGVEAVVHSDIPPGSGLSSSAALEMSTLLFLSQFRTETLPSRVDCALLCQKAEHEYAGVPCGIMDQFIISLARYSYVIKIDCRSLEYDAIPVSIGQDAVFVVTNSGVKHALANGEYAKRRANVKQAVNLLGVESWRDVSHDLIRTKSGSFIQDGLLDNALHVVGEIERTVKAAEALLDNNIVQFGKLMTESHRSLRDKYKVSCPELDELVDLALGFKGVFGSRMTGGGFGGCTVTLVRRDKATELEEFLAANYKGGSPTFYTCEPVSGAEVYSPSFLNI